MRISQTHTKN